MTIRSSSLILPCVSSLTRFRNNGPDRFQSACTRRVYVNLYLFVPTCGEIAKRIRKETK